MDSIVNKLSEIESAANAIVTHAEKQKDVLEDEYQKKREEFDAKLESDTQKKIDEIRQAMMEKTSSTLGSQSGSSSDTIEAIKREYDQHHTEYAQKILTKITEV
ncbi:MAG: hypothetical protein PHW34_04345 [Hespellia sp.]|nr:hypothetical protein [Hespellia sp.]